MSDNRDRGIEFGALTEDLESESYPMTKDEIVEKYGDRELEHSNGSSSVAEILPEEGEEEYENADAVHEILLNMVGEQAVGRDEYSDRGVGTAEQSEEDDPAF